MRDHDNLEQSRSIQNVAVASKWTTPLLPTGQKSLDQTQRAEDPAISGFNRSAPEKGAGEEDKERGEGG